eukprot:TRINITY_DN2438_c0_g1_i4.p1 TRINITY_DN2438_c0_g1~~TRINITY_DN2438_c0_g1_i4.p1  ORF type:complete len:506 (-),score=125.89 TRINITY_DN2438_c0_g1_i4:54-1571(-)
MLDSRSDWCLSRQRVWGLPIPVFYDVETDEPLITDESVSHIQKLISEKGSDCWWDLPDQELLAPQYRNNGKKYRKGTDTLDVWFDSGVSWEGVLRKRNLPYPATVYLEGSDQHRGWFQSSLLTSIATHGQSPYQQLITHGFLLDEKGQKMSKSLGNVVHPSEIILGGKDKKLDPAYGVDMLRFWVCSSDYTKDLLIGRSILAQVSNTLRKVRNTTRFLLGNLFDFDASNHLLPFDKLALQIDKYMMMKLHLFQKEITEAYDAYHFSRIYALLANFTSVELSSFYFDISKDRLYVEASDHLSRRSCQTVLFHMLQTINKAIAPVLPHVAEEIFHFSFKDATDKNVHETPSVFLTGWFSQEKEWKEEEIKEMEDKWKILLDIRSEVYKVMERARNDGVIGKALDGMIHLFAKEDSELWKTLSSDFGLEEVNDILITSKTFLHPWQPTTNEKTQNYSAEVSLILPNGKEEVLRIVVQKSSGEECTRCRKFVEQVQETFCPRCFGVMKS